jgi:hypothetical protein
MNMAGQENVRFSIIVFGAVALYTVMDWVPGIRHENGLSPTLLLFSFAVMAAAVFAIGTIRHSRN